jgi:hypothetical protein
MLRLKFNLCSLSYQIAQNNSGASPSSSFTVNISSSTLWSITVDKFNGSTDILKRRCKTVVSCGNHKVIDAMGLVQGHWYQSLIRLIQCYNPLDSKLLQTWNITWERNSPKQNTLQMEVGQIRRWGLYSRDGSWYTHRNTKMCKATMQQLTTAIKGTLFRSAIVLSLPIR